MTNAQLIDKVAFLYLVDGKILSTRSKGKDKYYIPGGKRESDETDVQTLAREIKEELSVDIIEPSAQLFGIFEAQAHGKAAGVVVRMTCYTADFVGDLKADSEIAELVWLTMADIEKVSPVDKLIFADLHSKGLLG
jgi:8-oxo-dGTP pyrophosphatase MutT (NUDIX family)